MHLMALGAFWPPKNTLAASTKSGLNAPYGAWWFLTDDPRLVHELLPNSVLMHLMTLGAI